MKRTSSVAVAGTAGVLAAALSAGDAGAAESALRRHAILVGNTDYVVAPDLRNTRNDVALVAKFLSEQGYEVLVYENLSKRGFEQMMRQALRDVDKDSEVVFYYAGHGLQIAGGNYLIPVDADLDDAYDVPFEAISLTSVVEILGARARVQLIILDSCRDNPFGNTRVLTDLSGDLSETREGFSTLTAPINSLLAFSTSPGAVAWDGDGDNSPFTNAMIEVARDDPAQPVMRVLEEVRRLVFERTQGRQVPWESSTLVEAVSFGSTSPATEGGPGTRGLLAMPLAEPATSEKPDLAGDAAVTLSARFEREVAIGAALGTALGADLSAHVEIIAPPANGNLKLLGDGEQRTVAGRGILQAEKLEGLIYARALNETPAGGAQAPVLTDSFRIAVDGRERVVEISLEPDPCDSAAGDHLDPEGTGLARYPNEIAPEAALEACLAAVTAYPGVGRFHYQLGRAQLALRDLDAARASFEAARDLGHTRAWYALGLVVANEAEATLGRSSAEVPPGALDLWREGVARGDPYAYHALGKQLLRFGGSEAERQEGFDLLSRALELGHTFAMNELGLYFVDADAPHSDPARGLRYLQESAARNDIYGYNNLGFVYRDGLAGIASDPAAAEAWFVKAAEGGHPQAPGNLGRLWTSGALGDESRVATAVEWYDVGLDRGDGWSGANAAWLIANEEVPGMGPRDAAIRAAKAAALGNAEAAEAAREVLADLPDAALDAAAQELINALGGSVQVDGEFGDGSEAEMRRVLGGQAEGIVGPAADRAVALAGAYWRASPLRVDLN